MNIVEAHLQEICNVICWDAKWDANLNLSINLGQPSLCITEPKEIKTELETLREFHKLRHVALRGEWLFWVLNGYWKLSIKEYGEVTSAESLSQKGNGLGSVDGQKLIHASINPQTSATQLSFDLGAELSIRRIGIGYDGDIWSLYKPNGYVLSVRADGKYHDNHGDTPREKIEWKPITMF